MRAIFVARGQTTRYYMDLGGRFENGGARELGCAWDHLPDSRHPRTAVEATAVTTPTVKRVDSFKPIGEGKDEKPGLKSTQTTLSTPTAVTEEGLIVVPQA
jgi:hypothetical protein